MDLIVIRDDVLRVRGVGHGQQQERVREGARDGKRRNWVQLLVRKYDSGGVEDDGFANGGFRLQRDTAPKQ